MTRFKRSYRRRRIMSGTKYLKSIVILCFGFLFGFFVSQTSRRYVVDLPYAKCQLSMVTLEQERRHANLSAELKTAKFFLLIGIMTADHLIRTRVKTINETWASTEGPVKVIYFTGSQGNFTGDVDVVHLPEADDRYPPQQKSFYMLKYVYERYMNDFHWFLRGDDDVYIRSDTLCEILVRFNSSDSLLLGQAGVGKPHEKGKLGLAEDENFCIGGPSVIMSQSLVRLVAPHLLTCLNQTASLHEDVELGRCIRRHVGVMCPWAREAQDIFYQIYEKPERAFSGSIKRKAFRKAVAIHPVKERSYMLQLHHHFLTSYFLELQHRASILNLRSRRIQRVVGEGKNSSRSFKKADFYDVLPRNSSPAWEFSNVQFLYGLSEPPLSWVSGPIFEGIRNVCDNVMRLVNVDARSQFQAPEDFKKLHTVMIRTHPTLGSQFNVDLETLVRTKKAKYVALPRHARHLLHLQQSFAPLSKNLVHDSSLVSHDQTIHFIVPLVGRLATFSRFLASFEKAFLVAGMPASLLVVYFSDVSLPTDHKTLFRKLRAKYPETELLWAELDGEFSRARALSFGVRRYGNGSLLFFADVDLVFDTEFSYRCRAGAILGQRVYFPIMFSQFNPEVSFFNQSVSHEGTFQNFTKRMGTWRKYSFGPVCVYSNDVIAVGGLNTSIHGWGLEDIDFYEKCIRHNLEVLRAPDVGLFHVYHAQTSCLDSRMNSMQAKMCEDSRLQGVGSAESLVDYMLAKGYV